ncbi:MAG TPA: AAA family ATPase [Gammaproteobacteria bacterium]|nr:AAA family ATPase [Gammaproteobacteria bacterium]
MGDQKDLELIFQSRIPIIVIQTHEEIRVLDMLKKIIFRLNKPLYSWTVTEGLGRIDLNMGQTDGLVEPLQVLRHIKASPDEGIYILLDFHPFLEDPVNARLIKEIAQAYYKTGHHLVFVSHEIDIPDDLRKLSAQFELQLPDAGKLLQIIKDEAFAWSTKNNNRKVSTDNKTLDALVRNLGGLSTGDVRRLARKVIFDDGAITESDLSEVMSAKYELLNQDGLLSFEYDTQEFSNVGGMSRLKRWLELRKIVFQNNRSGHGLESPKGILLLGVQGCGKSLMCRAVAGIFSVPLLRLDFGVLYNKFFGESEKNLRQALHTAEVMSPCVLWIDEIEKGLATGDNDGGTSRRVLGTLLTWMAENNKMVFLVATANGIDTLPPELIRKGRFDEIFFVDLPDSKTRSEIFPIHLQKRGMNSSGFDPKVLSAASEGFSGAEIEQAIVAALYVSYAEKKGLSMEHILNELASSRPLSVVMAEKIQQLRSWAAERTVSVE